MMKSKCHEIFKKVSRNVKKFDEIIKHFKVKYFIAHLGINLRRNTTDRLQR